MIFHPSRLAGAFCVELQPRGDDRGWFARTFCAKTFAEHGVASTFVQQNLSSSKHRGTLRGMHFQNPPFAETKVVRCARGEIVDVLVDLRPESPTFRQWEAFELSERNQRMVIAPPGFGHGFQTLCDDVEVTYLVSSPYTPEAEGGVRWDDPAIGITWPLVPTVMSPRDRAWPDLTWLSRT